MSQAHTVRLLARESCGADVVLMRFEKPDSYEYKPAQWLRLTLETATGPETKTFTHASAPADADIDIVTRLSGSAFKSALGDLEPGDEVRIAGPGGRLRLPDGTARAAFLAGGVGITPARSILRDRMHRRERFADAVLVYGNRDEECAPFLDEFEQMAGLGVRVIPVYEHVAEGSSARHGFITAALVREAMGEDDGRPFVVAGPPAMVEAMEALLDELGIDNTRRLVERFGTA